jgi:hypothetical protein
VFSKQIKSASTRLREAELRAQIERARVRVDLLSREKSRLEEENSAMVDQKKALAILVEEKSSFLMRCFHGLAKEKAHFREWMAEFEQAIINFLFESFSFFEELKSLKRLIIPTNLKLISSILFMYVDQVDGL